MRSKKQLTFFSQSDTSVCIYSVAICHANLRIRVCGVSLDVAIPRPIIFLCDKVVDIHQQ